MSDVGNVKIERMADSAPRNCAVIGRNLLALRQGQAGKHAGFPRFRHQTTVEPRNVNSSGYSLAVLRKLRV